MPLPDDYSIFPILSELSACLCAELSVDGPPCFCGVTAGSPPEVPLDDCENCAAGYVRLDTAFPSTQSFPEPDAQANCRSVMAFSVTVGIVRCAPMGEGGEPPTPEELAEFARDIFADMAAIRRSIRCCLTDDKFEDIEYVLGTYTMLPVQGGVGGGEWSLTIQEMF